MNLIFAGTPDFAARHLQALIDAGHNIVAVYTQPDRPAGRGKKLSPSPVKHLALQNSLSVRQPLSLKNAEAQSELANLNADAMVVVAYGLLLPQAVLDAPRYGCFNVHASLLPRWRGAAPIQRAIEAGDKESGITIMQMDIGLDTGAMLHKVRCPIEETDSAGSLHDRLAELGPAALLETLQKVEEQNTRPLKQDDALATYASKIEKAEAEICWSEPAEEIARKIRAFNPFPVCFSVLKGERLKIHSARAVALNQVLTPGTVLSADRSSFCIACGKGAIEVVTLQLPGKKIMSLQEFANGYAEHFVPGTILGT